MPKINKKKRKKKIFLSFAEKMKQNIVEGCSVNLDKCYLIGSEQKALALYMKYCTFEYLFSCKPIGDKTNNGFNFLLTYARDFNTNKEKASSMVQSSCVLKSSRGKQIKVNKNNETYESNSDNLLYEYLVGNWLNEKINETCPFFVCTHSLFYYKTKENYFTMKNLFDSQQKITKVINKY